MSDALSRYGIHNTPPTQPIIGREADMVKNDAGGYVFFKDVWTRLADFLVLGTEGGTYYADERKHTYLNIKTVVEALTLDGPRAVQLAVEYSTARPARVAKNYPCLYVVATALASPDLDTRRAASQAVPKVARTVDHLSHLVGYFKQAKGGSGVGGAGGRSLPGLVHRAWLGWFLDDQPNRVAYKLLKAGQRKTGDGESFRPGDLLRLARPKPVNEIQDALFGLATGKKSVLEVTGHFAAAKAYYEAQRADTPAKAIKVIRAYHVPWEFLPDSVMKSPEVWRELIPHLGLTALIRNLARMTEYGVFAPLADSVTQVKDRLCDQGQLHSAGLHPFDVMLARVVYAAGWSQPNIRAPRRSWTPNAQVVGALDRAFELAGAVADRHPGKLIVAVDRSGSMSRGVQHGGTGIGSAYHVSSASAMSLLRTWDTDSHAVEFDNMCYSSQLRAGMSLGEIMRLPHNGGATDLAAPIAWALKHKVKCDAFVIFTDNETWSGRRHSTHVLGEYRRKINPNVRVIVASITASGYTVGDPKDPGVMNVSGFDSNLPTLVAGYLAAGGDS